ncbi:MAG TPA: NAD(P)/FAD-dependent oxidoreductase [Anaerolineales bacterium]
MGYDIIIAGGSFAGLAVAVQMRGKRVLMVEPHAIGSVQNSACGTLLAVLEATGTVDSLLQVQNRLVLHLGESEFEYPLPYSFCTFDFRIFCNRLLLQSNVEVLRASVLGHRGHEILTTRGIVSAKILIDATGWRAALATNSRQQTQHHAGRSFGLETTIPTSEDGLHFYYEPSRLPPFTVGWLFPIGTRARAGLGSYLGQTRMAEALADFTHSEFGLSPDGRHGGYFPYRRQQPTTGCVFRIGDAAGQCIPLTGEGIRPALHFGAMAGRLVRRVLDGEIREANALREYRNLVRRHAEPYRYLLAVQKLLPRLPMAWIERIAGRVKQPDVLDPLLRWYWKSFNPDTLARLWQPGKLISTKLPSLEHTQNALGDSERTAL